MSERRGLLLVNLGSPEACTLPAVKSYLQEFLMDEDVITLPKVLRALLVYGVITPTRSKRSLHAYQSIWNNGSPLIQNTHMLAADLQDLLGNEWRVDYAMRYKNPSIETVLARFKEAEITDLTIIPLYPQSAAAVTGSVIKAVKRAMTTLGMTNKPFFIPEFYGEDFFIKSFAAIVEEHREHHPFDRLLMSYHGLPENAVVKQGCQHKAKCAQCPSTPKALAACYRAQCFETSRRLAHALQLNPTEWSIGFQSRLGRLPWIGPNTEDQLQLLWDQGVRSLAVICPSFVADCLETLEEINIRAREIWEAKGGTFNQIPCLNAHPVWVKNLAEHLNKKL